MPRIAAASIAEHVAHQEAAVIAAARRLFITRGVADVTLGDIADAVGLARTSLYRYFPTKAHIVQAWFERAIGPHILASVAIADAPGPPAERLEQWITLQLDFLLDAENDAMIVAALESTDMPTDVRRAIGARHEELYATLRRILAGGAATPPATVAVRVMMIAGMLRSCNACISGGAVQWLVRDELRRGAQAIAVLD